jgi:transaldolase
MAALLRQLAGPGISVWSDPETLIPDRDLLAGGAVTGVGPSAPARGQAARLARRLAAVHAASGGTDGLVQVPASDGSPAAANLMPGLPFSVEGLAAAEALALRGTAVALGPVFTPAELRLAGDAYRRGLERRLAAGGAPGGPAVLWLPIAAIDEYAAGYIDGVGAALAVLVYLESFRLRADARWQALRAAGAAPPRPGFCRVPATRLQCLSLPGAILALPPRTLANLGAPLSLSEPDETEAAWTLRQARDRGLDPVAMARALRA